MNPFYKNLALWLVISLMMVMLFQMFKHPDRSKVNVSYSDFLNMVDSGGVNQVTIQGENITGMSGQGPFKTYAPKDPELITMLRSKGVAITAKPVEESPWFQVLLSWVPMLLLIGVWIFFHATDAGWWRKSNVIREKSRKTHDRCAGKGYL